MKTFPIICPHCKTDLDAEERLAGKVVACPACGKPLTVPRHVPDSASGTLQCSSRKKNFTPASTPAPRPEATSGSIQDTETQWRKLFFSKKVVVALPVAIAVAAPIALLGAAFGMRPNASVAHVGKAAAVALFGKK